jgi:hypothetical protein
MQRHRRYLAGALAAMVAAAGLTVVGPDPAQALVVVDEPQLQAAFADVNETEIVLANSIDLTCVGGGDLDRNAAAGQPLTIRGGGFTIRQTCAGERVIENLGDGPLALLNVTIGGGTPAASGGGIATEGDLSVVESTVTGNSTGGSGGGIFANTERVEITRSTITGNTAVNVGGGLQGIGANQVVTVTNSTITGNMADEAGGIGVQADADPGLVLVYSTVVGNTALAGANIGGRRFTAFGTVIALGSGGGTDCFVPFITTNGYNFGGDASCELLAATDRQGAGDPLVGPLGANGGPTTTRLPANDSPLVDGIPTASCQADGAAGVTTDQRLVSRPQLDGCDIGAVEIQVALTFTG